MNPGLLVDPVDATRRAAESLKADFEKSDFCGQVLASMRDGSGKVAMWTLGERIPDPEPNGPFVQNSQVSVAANHQLMGLIRRAGGVVRVALSFFTPRPVYADAVCSQQDGAAWIAYLGFGIRRFCYVEEFKYCDLIADPRIASIAALIDILGQLPVYYTPVDDTCNGLFRNAESTLKPFYLKAGKWPSDLEQMHGDYIAYRYHLLRSQLGHEKAPRLEQLKPLFDAIGVVNIESSFQSILVQAGKRGVKQESVVGEK